MDFVKLNDTPVHVAGFKQRKIERPGESPLQQFELVVIVRDQKSHQSFLELLGDGNIHLDLPSDSGEGWTSYETVVLQSLHTTSTHGNIHLSTATRSHCAKPSQNPNQRPSPYRLIPTIPPHSNSDWKP